ncbi:MAG: hypothetical protein J6Y69_08260 [Treponema sp.]|nr:hypothetical protein [Treponema sp.]
MNKRTPLIDLHCHLDGSITADIARSLARIQSTTLPAEDDDKLNRLLSVGEDCKSLNDFLKCFDLPLSLLQTEAGIRECVHLVQENVKSDGVVYL